MALVYTGNQDRMTVTIGSNYTVADGSIVLTGGHGARLPTTGDFWLKPTGGVTYQVWKCTSRSTDTLTVTPAEDGTTDTNVASGVELEWTLGEAALDQKRVDQHQVGVFASAASNKAGNIYFPTDAASILRDDGSAFSQSWGPIWPHDGVPQSGWTTDNQDSATITTAGGLHIINKIGAGTASTYTGSYRTAPTAPYTLDILLGLFTNVPTADNADQNGWGLGWGDSAGKYVIIQGGQALTQYVAFSKHSAVNTPVADYSVSTGEWIKQVCPVTAKYVWVRIEDNNTNLLAYFTSDVLQARYQFESQARTDYLSSPTRVAVLARGNDMAVSVMAWKEG
jgi:hypothetical protein